jgi:hypothetical protein
MIDEDRTTEYALTLVLGTIVVLVGGGLYVLHHSGEQVQHSILTTPPAPAASEGQDSPPDTAPADSHSEGQPAPLPSIASEVQPDFQSPKWVSQNLQHVKTYFIPDMKAAPASSPPKATTPTDASYSHPPVADPGLTETDDDTEMHVLAWKNPPHGIQPASGDILEMHTPGVDIDHIEVTGVIEEGSQSVWLLKVSGRNVDLVDRVIHNRPHHLKITIRD